MIRPASASPLHSDGLREEQDGQAMEDAYAYACVDERHPPAAACLPCCGHISYAYAAQLGQSFLRCVPTCNGRHHRALQARLHGLQSGLIATGTATPPVADRERVTQLA